MICTLNEALASRKGIPDMLPIQRNYSSDRQPYARGHLGARERIFGCPRGLFTNLINSGEKETHSNSFHSFNLLKFVYLVSSRNFQGLVCGKG
jgi:hypothetical protein